MRFHVVSMPHTQTTAAYTACAFTEKVRKFCIMMKDLGHEVFLYAGDQNEAPCDELITCVTEADRAAFVGNQHFSKASFDYTLPAWTNFNQKAIEGIKQRAQPHDFVRVIMGLAHKQIADALPHMLTVEFGVGYGGFFSPYKVFESYAWMHTCYGSTNRDPTALDGNWWDVVIPGYLEPEVFPFRAVKDDYYLFAGRLIDRKGYDIARQVCERLGKRLVVIGEGTPPAGSDYRGVVGPKERGELMAGAIASFAPTLYIEPFGNVAVEAMACGTPVISTDWGAFTETVVNGVTGYRCRTFEEFLAAAEAAKYLNPHKIREFALSRFALDVVGPQYEAYFERLSMLWSDGWYGKTSSTTYALTENQAAGIA